MAMGQEEPIQHRRVAAGPGDVATQLASPVNEPRSPRASANAAIDLARPTSGRSSSEDGRVPSNASPEASGSSQLSAIPEEAMLGLRELTHRFYRAYVFYQGAEKEAAEQRRREGMDPAEKKESSVDAVLRFGVLKEEDREKYGREREQAYKHMYHIRHKDDVKVRLPDREVSLPGAKRYATLNAMTKQGGAPKLNRSIITVRVAQEIGLERDPGALQSDAFRHAGRLEAGYVLKSKKSLAEPSAASEELRAAINQFLQARAPDVAPIDAQQAAELLKAEQSDSDDDF